MKRKPPAQKRRKTTMRVGDRVATYVGRHKVEALLVEDRGPLGPGGKKILRIRLCDETEREYETFAENVLPL